MRKGDLAWFGAFAAVTAVLVVPASHQAFVGFTAAHPYLSGFAKFALMATMGELLALRVISGAWKATVGLLPKALVWGLVGMAIVLMFALFSDGVAGLVSRGYLWVGEGITARILSAFFTSLLMNTTFGVAFMAAHRICDTWIDAWMGEGRRSLGAAAASVDWKGFVGFVVGRTIPLFWIPAHTLTFLLPPEYRVMAAAYLSIALGLILAWARRRRSR